MFHVSIPQCGPLFVINGVISPQKMAETKWVAGGIIPINGVMGPSYNW